MNTFTKKPLYKNKTKTMKKIYIILAFVIALLLTYSAYNFHALQELKSTLISTTQAYETAIQPSELDKLLIADDNSKIERQENRKEIEAWQALIDEKEARNKELRQDEYERAKKVQELTGISFQ